jgi:hypothetical protein
MSYEDLQQRFAKGGYSSLAASLEKLVGEQVDELALRTSVERNLHDGRMRLVIAVDHIGQELRAIVEFLNQMTTDRLQILALELSIARDGGVEILVPAVYGQEAVDQKIRSSARWSRHAFADAVEPDGAAGVAFLEVLDWACSVASKVVWGTGEDPNVSIWCPVEGEDTPCLFFSRFAAGPMVGIQFGSIVDRKISPARIESLVSALRMLPGGQAALQGLEDAQYRKWPRLRAADALVDSKNRKEFVRIISEFVDQVDSPAGDADALLPGDNIGGE